MRTALAIFAIVPFIVAGCANGPAGSSSESAATASAPSIPNLELPPGTEVVKPGADVPADLAAWSGKWGGIWSGILPSDLVIERISAEGDVQGVYAYGYASQWNITPGSFRFRGKIKDGVLKFGRGRTFEFEMTKDGKLSGQSWRGGVNDANIVMAKAQ